MTRRAAASAPARTRRARPVRIYLAGPLFTAAERAFNVTLRDRLLAAGTTGPALEVQLPQEFCAVFEVPGAPPDFPRIRRACLDHLRRADVVLAVLDGPDIDSGTAYECGVADVLGIATVGLRTDLRQAENRVGNCMITVPITVHATPEAAVAAVQRVAARLARSARG